MEILNTPCGPIRGVPGRVPGTVAYKGIHYATAGRWELPREVTHWDGVFDGSGYGHCSYQPRAFLHGIKECRGDQKVNCPQGQEATLGCWSSADFAKAKSVAARRKSRLFSFRKSENQRFSADEQCSPLHT